MSNTNPEVSLLRQHHEPFVTTNLKATVCWFELSSPISITALSTSSTSLTGVNICTVYQLDPA